VLGRHHAVESGRFGRRLIHAACSLSMGRNMPLGSLCGLDSTFKEERQFLQEGEHTLVGWNRSFRFLSQTDPRSTIGSNPAGILSAGFWWCQFRCSHRSALEEVWRLAHGRIANRLHLRREGRLLVGRYCAPFQQSLEPGRR
jgi:hypothetical protein